MRKNVVDLAFKACTKLPGETLSLHADQLPDTHTFNLIIISEGYQLVNRVVIDGLVNLWLMYYVFRWNYFVDSACNSWHILDLTNDLYHVRVISGHTYSVHCKFHSQLSLSRRVPLLHNLILAPRKNEKEKKKMKPKHSANHLESELWNLTRKEAELERNSASKVYVFFWYWEAPRHNSTYVQA